MRKKIAALLLLIVIIGVVIAGVAYAQNTANTQAETAGIPAPMISGVKYIYAAKYVCGDGTQSEAVVPGKYMTAINIHNPQTANVSLSKKVAQAPREDDRPIPPSKKITYLIQPDYAFDIDCADITKIGGISTAFSTGFVVIESPKQLDVVGVYTSIGPNSADVTLDVETVSPKAVIPTITTVAADLPID